MYTWNFDKNTFLLTTMQPDQKCQMTTIYRLRMCQSNLFFSESIMAAHQNNLSMSREKKSNCERIASPTEGSLNFAQLI